MARTLEIIEAEIKINEKKYDTIFCSNNNDKYKTLESFLNALSPFKEKLMTLSREKRMIMPYVLSDLPEDADVMTLKDFIECVKDGTFIDDDGSGNYIKDGQMTNIDIYPSDVEYKAIRKEFDEIIWFNK